MTPVALPFPDVCFLVSDFVLDPGVEQAVHGGGLAATASRVREPLWSARFDTGPVTQSERIAWLDWSDDLDGGLVPFLAPDTSLGLPQAYWSAGAMPGGWSGAAVVTGLPTPSQVALSGLPANYQATKGDRIGLVETVGGRVRHGYFRITANAAANAGGTMTATVRPFVPSLFTTAARAQLVRPVCALRLARGGFRAPAAIRPTVSFSAVQVL